MSNIKNSIIEYFICPSCGEEAFYPKSGYYICKECGASYQGDEIDFCDYDGQPFVKAFADPETTVCNSCMEYLLNKD